MRRRGLYGWLPVLAALGVMAPGCKDDEGELVDDGVGTTTEDMSDDVGTSSTGDVDHDDDHGDPTEGEPVPFDFTPVFGTPNLDDDDENGQLDWLQLPFDADNDVSILEVPGVPEGYMVEMTLTGDLEHIRIWRGDAFIGHGTEPIEDTLRFAPGPDGDELQVEFADYNVTGVLRATLIDPNDAVVHEVDVGVHSSPLIMNHHLQPAEHLWVVELSGNGAMIADLEAVLGDRLTRIPGAQYNHDVWIQDEIEFATSVGAQGQRLDTVIDSIRERGLKNFPKTQLVYPDSIARMWGNPNDATTFDAFGNLEASPPVTVDGVDYPFGRIYYGREGNWGLHPDLEDQLATQQVQAPFQVPTAWLCVGHVDEIATFIPDPSSPKGFKLLYADVPSALEILDSLDPSMQLPRYAPDWPNGHGIGTVGGLLSESIEGNPNITLRAYNEDVQALRLDPIREQFKAELGLDDSDIILIPAYWEHVGGCGTLALVPGTVNLTVANVGDVPHLFMPDTFFRSDIADQSSDPFIQDFIARMPDGVELHFVDNWYVYHMYSGEVHCGTNVRRTPTTEWFDTAMHLLED